MNIETATIGRAVFLAAGVLAINLTGCAVQSRSAGAGIAQESAGWNAGSWSNDLANEPRVVFVGDGNYFVDVRAKPSDPSMTRQVTRLKVSKFAPNAPTTVYRALLANNRLNEGGPWTYKQAARPGAGGTTNTNDATESAISMPESGAIVLSGTAPIVIVKTATVASEGTKFVVETTANGGWLLKVLEADALHPVRVHFPGSGVPARVVAPDACLRFPQGATNPNQGVPADPVDCASLTQFATLLFDSTQ